MIKENLGVIPWVMLVKKPLGERAGYTGKSRYCGVETEFSYDITNVIAHNVLVGGFDFVVTPLAHPECRPSIIYENLRFADSDYKVTTEEWSDHIVGKISTWIDLDSDDETIRLDSERAIKHEVAWASYLSIQACLLPAPKGTCFVNYARCVNQILQDTENTQLWLRIPMGDDDSSARSSTSVDFWETWNSFRLLCDHHSQLLIVLDILNPLPSDNSLERWFGEPVIAAIIHTDDYFSTKARGNNKYLSRRMQKLITDFFNHSIQIIISGKQDQPQADSKEHPFRPHRDYIGHLYQRMDPLTERESLEFGVRDFLNSPLQPLKNYSLFLTYADFEKDAVKYLQYEKAICQALLDRVPDEKASETTIVLMVVGAGRGPLVRASLEAAKETGRKLRVYAVEKNEHAFFALNELIRFEGWVNSVIPVLRDVRYWHAPEKADIMVSELLGSFGDNELSPEFLDEAQRFLKNNGISIPSSYTSFLQPVAASKYYNDIKARKDGLNFETPCVVNIHNVARLAPTQPVFTFTHRKRYDMERNQRYKKVLFVIPSDTGSAMVHGFAGYFDATLYKDVNVGIEPSTKTPKLFSWFPMFFPLETPICVVRGSTLEVHFWRCCDSTKVWYEWCVASPSSSIHNSNGSSYSVGL